jgi:formylglycine-generating enzyme
MPIYRPFRGDCRTRENIEENFRGVAAMKKLLTILGVVGVLLSAMGTARGDVLNMGGVRDPATGVWTGLASVEFVPVGNAGNAADPDTGYGKVDYAYNIGKYDVTAGQYCEFLNATAKISDPYGLYNANMNTAVHAGGCNIKRTGAAGNYSYTVAADWANRPVNFVSWGDAARFCNWLDNGQQTGSAGALSTEYGAYTLNGAITDAALIQVTRNVNAQYFIPSLDEWYKSAYFDPKKNGPGSPGYWLTPLRRDTAPSNVLDPTGMNNANFFDLFGTGNGTYTVGGPYWRTDVGALAASPSSYGTFDQGGNVGNFVETVVDLKYFRAFGTDFKSPYSGMLRIAFNEMFPTFEGEGSGVRIGGTAVPEPSVLLMLLLCGAAGFCWRCLQS